MKAPGKHSHETLQRMRANAEAARRRLARLNEEYRLLRQAKVPVTQKLTVKADTFGEAISRIAKQYGIAI